MKVRKRMLGFWGTGLLFLMSIATNAALASNIPTLVWRDSMQHKIVFEDSLLVFVDQIGDLSIAEAMALADDAFSRPPQQIDQQESTTVWVKLRMRNDGTATRYLYFSYCQEAYGFWTYEVDGDQLVNQRYSGKDQRPLERVYPSRQIYAPVSLDPGSERIYLFKVIFKGKIDPSHFVHLSIRPKELVHHFFTGQYAWNSFYAGAMLLLSIFSLFLFGIFRQRSFVYFAMQTLCFVLYFVESSGMVEGFFTTYFQSTGINLIEWVISGLTISVFLFFTQYLQLKERGLLLYRIYFATTFIFTIYMFVTGWLGIPYLLRAQSYNLLLPIWIIMTAGIVVYLTWKGYKEARILIISIGVLILGALFVLLTDSFADYYSMLGYGVFQFGTMLSSGILFYSLFDKINIIRREKLHMEELDKLKSKFFANISHEFRTPLTLIMGPLQQLMEETEDPKSRELLAMAKRNAERQLALVNQLLELSTYEAGVMELGGEVQDFGPFLRGVVNAYASLAEQKDIALVVDCPPEELPVFFNQEKMESILYNLLSNAFKFTESGGQIAVKVLLDKQKVLVSVIDTGTGIDPEELPQIFDRFFQAKEGMNAGLKGSGIGLALTKELVILHGGEISVESEPGKGTSFLLQFPLADAGILSEDTGSLRTEGPVVLVIEDNQDVRLFIRQRLSGTFHIEEAVNGKEGVKRAQDLMPDLIISDVMMPELDGFQVCQMLKTDLQTCHIPIILLTAKASVPEKLEGLETGADDYLTKPFDSNELIARVQNLIKLRQQLRQRFAASISVKPSEVVTNSRDKEFLENVVRIIEENLGVEGFGVEELASKVDISKPNLNRKIRALVDQSTNQLIQSIRLQRAVDLLDQNAGNISEIAVLTGYSSTAYFVKCFKDKYGETPGTYQKKGN